MTYYILTSKTKPGNALQRAIEQLTDAIDHRTNNNPDQFEKDLNEHILKLNAPSGGKNLRREKCTSLRQIVFRK